MIPAKTPAMIPAITSTRLLMAVVAASVLAFAGGCAGPYYTLPEPLATPTMAFPSQASPPLPAYATPLDDAPVSMRLDGDGSGLLP